MSVKAGSFAGAARISLATRAALLERRPDGSLLLRSPVALGQVPRNLGSYLRHWARVVPQRPFIFAKPSDSLPFEPIGYGAALDAARCVAQWLIQHGLDATRPVLVLSHNSVEHALLALGCLLAGVPYAPVSVGLSLESRDFRKLRQLTRLLQPGLVFAQDELTYGRALEALRQEGAPSVNYVTKRPAASSRCIAFDRLLDTLATDAVEQRSEAVDGATVVKYLFTSGSTGEPKAVPNTHLMLCANQQMMKQVVHPNPATPPVFVDWLPWSHTFGGNVIFNWALREGGTLYLDMGRPVAQEFERTLSSLREASPTHYFNVPVGYAMLAEALEQDASLRERFFAKLSFCFYGGASLPQSVWDRLQSIAFASTGRELTITTGCGSTETGPIATFLHWPVNNAGIIGLPVPGVSLKLVPNGDRFEMRLKGPNIFPGYHRNPQASAAAFDGDGFYRTGDAVRLVNDEDPCEGLVFDGRISEDFKLGTGTFVQVGKVRVSVLSAVPLLRDAVLVGPDRPWLAVLAWLEPAGLRVDGLPDQHLRRSLLAQLRAYNASVSGSSRRVRRILLLSSPASADAGEVTEKGYINQKAVMKLRSADVDTLYASTSPSERLLFIDEPADIWNPPAD